MRSLYVDYNLDGAQKTLLECEAVLRSDFFVSTFGGSNLIKSFMNNGRELVFDMYCRIHSKIDLPTLIKSLHLEASDAEAWITEVCYSINFEIYDHSYFLHILQRYVHYNNF